MPHPSGAPYVAETLAKQRDRIAELEAALRPFSQYAVAMAKLGRPHPQSGEVYVVRSGDEPVALTVEHFKAASAALPI